jgi:hypothetical protein
MSYEPMAVGCSETPASRLRRGTRSTLPGSSDSVFGGSDYAGGPIPVRSALLTINGRSHSFVPADGGAASIATDGSRLTRAEHRGTEDAISSPTA